MAKRDTITTDKLLANGYAPDEENSNLLIKCSNGRCVGVYFSSAGYWCLYVADNDEEIATFKRLRTMAQVNFITNAYLFG